MELSQLPEIDKDLDFKLDKIEKRALPHYYCITPEHLKYNDGIYLGKEQIERMEKYNNVKCGIKNCNVPYNEHKEVEILFIAVKDNKDLNAISGLNDYLVKIKPILEENKIEGIAFPEI